MSALKLSNDQSRIVWVDVLKFICIISVMAEHSAFMPDIVDSFVAPYFLNGFFFVSGYTYNHREGFYAFFEKKCRQLLIPWLVFSFFIIGSGQLLSFNSHQDFLTLLKWNFLQIRYHDDEMWFVAALFIAFIPFYFFIDSFQRRETTHKILKYTLLAWVLSFASISFSTFFSSDLLPWGSTPNLPAVLPWHLEYMFQAMFYMSLGYFYRIKWESNFNISRPLCFILCVFYFGLICFPLGQNKLLIIVANYMKAFVGITALICVSKTIHFNRYIAFIGRNTIIYYGLHGKAESVIQAVFYMANAELYNNLVWGEIPLLQTVCCIAEAFIVSVLLLIPVWLINRYMPCVAGHISKKNKMLSPY